MNESVSTDRLLSYLERRHDDLLDGGKVSFPEDLRLLAHSEDLAGGDRTQDLGHLPCDWYFHILAHFKSHSEVESKCGKTLYFQACIYIP